MTRKQQILWDADESVAGGKTSIAILLEWLSAPGNYFRWKHGYTQEDGPLEPLTPKIELLREILGILASHGITHRLATDLRSKINTLKRNYIQAALFLRKHEAAKRSQGNSERAVAVNDDADARAMAHVYTLCRYFDTLHPVMKDDVDDVAAASVSSSDGSKKMRKKKTPSGDENEDEYAFSDGDSSLESSSSPVQKRHREEGANKGHLSLRELKKRKYELEVANLEYDSEVKRLQVARERVKTVQEVVLGRKRLQDAGISMHDIDVILPARFADAEY
uniref:Uncharacterized protein n=1 Tax=Globisporangium ultimum (strain ATCC 200006 / CBS 805.95 / DAOM BR144) TaxID=431595 RepID=K3WJ55_GLOUD